MKFELEYKDALLLSEVLAEAIRGVPNCSPSCDKEEYQKNLEYFDNLVEDYICRRRHAAQDWYQEL